MKNKGYTLLELLGVIVILSVLITLVFPSVINFIKKSNDKIDNINNELIISAAEDYINDNSSNLYLTSGTEYCISVNTLIGKQYLSNIDDDNLYSSKSVKVTYNDKTNYEVVDSCYVCKLVSGEQNELGSKYQCKVKDNMEPGFENGYYFHLLSVNDDNTINLIMERNMYYDTSNDVGIVATFNNRGNAYWYYLTNNNSYGPVTAMEYLHNATKDWDNVSNIIIDYEDEGNKGSYGYGSIKTKDNITVITSKSGEETARLQDLKSRMPTYDEVHGEDKCLTREEDFYHRCPLWLGNYLSSIRDVLGQIIPGAGIEGAQNIDGIYGYWTLSSSIDSSSSARYVDYYGLLDENITYQVNTIGVRPVITVKNIIELN